MALNFQFAYLKYSFIHYLTKYVQNYFCLSFVRSLKRKVKQSPVTGLEWPRGFQEVKVPRYSDNSTGWW